jgi:hypothetical protein
MKMKTNGTINKYNVRLVVRGFRKQECVNYFDTYSPGSIIASIQILISIITIKSLKYIEYK